MEEVYWHEEIKCAITAGYMRYNVISISKHDSTYKLMEAKQAMAERKCVPSQPTATYNT